MYWKGYKMGLQRAVGFLEDLLALPKYSKNSAKNKYFKDQVLFLLEEINDLVEDVGEDIIETNHDNTKHTNTFI